MIVYRIVEPAAAVADLDTDVPAEPADGCKPVFARTRADARALLSQHPPVFRAGFLVERVEVYTSAANVVDMLNGHAPADMRVLVRWRGTSRGGLKGVE